MKTVTACTMDCPDTCSLVVSIDNGKPVRLRGNPDHPVTAGFTCKKIRKHLARLNSPDRIRRPLCRRKNGWEPVSWDQALDLCAAKIDSLRGEPESIVHIHGSGAQGVLKAVPRLFFDRLGATRVRGSLCDAAGFMAFVHDFGSRKNNDISDLANAHRIVNWGKDLPRSSIHIAAAVAKARRNKARLLTISPGGDGSSAFSDDHIRIRPGTDRFLAAAVIRRWLESEPVDERIPLRSRHWDRFGGLLARRTEGDLLAACGVGAEEVGRLLDFYRAAGPTASLVGTGLQRYRYGGENVRWINALALVSGNVGRSGGGSYYHLHSYANLDLGWAEAETPGPRRSFFKPTLGREIEGAADPPIRMAWINGVNIVNQAPDSARTARALKNIDFTVVVDAFFNDTVDCADLILPAALMLEQEDIVGSFLHDYVQYVPAVVAPPPEAKPDDQIIRELAGRVSPEVAIPDRETCLARSLASSRLETDLQRLRKAGSVRARRSAVPYEGLRFDHPDGKYRFPLALHDEPPPPEGYPLRLLSLIRKESMHSQILAEEQTIPPSAWVAPDCPYLERLDLSRETYVASARGRLKVRLQTLEGLHPEAVVYRRGDWMKLGGGINRLIEDGLTDIGGGAPYYQQYVRLEN
jgi:anaerobic selenocysteine-containing dehydrogenase